MIPLATLLFAMFRLATAYEIWNGYALFESTQKKGQEVQSPSHTSLMSID